MAGQIDKIIAYECGELGIKETIELFSELIQNGTVWGLQGHYGRTATQLIEQGFITNEGEVNEESVSELIEVEGEC